MGWVRSWVHKFTWQWVVLGRVSYLVGWVGLGRWKLTHGQLWDTDDLRRSPADWVFWTTLDHHVHSWCWSAERVVQPVLHSGTSKQTEKANRSHWTYVQCDLFAFSVCFFCFYFSFSDNQLNAISVASHNRFNSLHNDRVASIFSRQSPTLNKSTHKVFTRLYHIVTASAKWLLTCNQCSRCHES